MRSLDDLTLYVYGLLDASEEADIETHAKACAECRSRIGQIAAERRLFEKALQPQAAASSPHRERRGRLRR